MAWDRLDDAVLALVSLTAAACGSSGTGTTDVTYVAVAGGKIAFGTTESPSGAIPHPGGRHPGTRTVLGAVLPSPYVVSGAGAPTANSNLIVQAEPVNLKPQTIVYTLNPKAVWSDGVPITAADFRYAWEQQREDTSPAGQDVANVAGYRDIASVIGSNQGRTVTVRFKRTFADWESLFSDLLPAHVMEQVGWNPACKSVDPSIDLSGGPFKIGAVSPRSITLKQNPKWWGTPANSRQITVRIASSTEQLAQWMSAGTVQVAQPATVTPSFLSSMTSLPDASSEVDLSGTQLQLDMASSLDSAPLAGPAGRDRPVGEPPEAGGHAGELGHARRPGGQQPRLRSGPAGLQGHTRILDRRRPSRRPRPRRPRRRTSTRAGA